MTMKQNAQIAALRIRRDVQLRRIYSFVYLSLAATLGLQAGEVIDLTAAESRPECTYRVAVLKTIVVVMAEREAVLA